MPGASGVGIGPSGHDYVATPTDPVAKTAPLGLHYQPATRDAEMLDDGRLAADHPVDAWMDLALSIRRGSLKSSPDVGHTLHEIEYLDSTLEANVRSRVAAACASRVAAGDVRIDRVQAQRAGTGYVALIDYTNLRTQTQPTRQIRVNL